MRNIRIARYIGVAVGWAWLAWSAPASRASMIITGETATHTADDTISIEFPINAVNNSGITINSPDLVTDSAITHNAGGFGNGWAADNFVGTVLGESLLIDLGQTYNVDGFRVWNYNGAAGTDVGLQLFDLESSTDGINWTLRLNDQLLAQNPNSGGNPTDPTLDGVYFANYMPGTRYVRVTIVDTYRGSDDFGGLSEIMFSAIPEPSTIMLLAAGGLILWRRRN